jgi:hypothetical protein
MAYWNKKKIILQKEHFEKDVLFKHNIPIPVKNKIKTLNTSLN